MPYGQETDETSSTAHMTKNNSVEITM